MPRLSSMREPGSRVHEPHGEQLHVETQMAHLYIHGFFGGREQITEQGTQTGIADDARHVLVTRAETTATAAMREHDNAAGTFRNLQCAVEPGRTSGNLDVALPDRVRYLWCTHGDDLLPGPLTSELLPSRELPLQGMTPQWGRTLTLLTRRASMTSDLPAPCSLDGPAQLGLMPSSCARLYSSSRDRSSRATFGFPVPWVRLLSMRLSSRRCLCTVRAAISLARFSEAPRSRALSFMCSYCRSSFLLQEGICTPRPYHERTHCLL